MPRLPRIEYPGAYYHVINQGVNRSNIYHTEQDYITFLKCLSAAHQKYEIECHGFCLMPNHYHLIIRTPVPHLSMAIRTLSGTYAQYFNRTHERDGPLFKGRFQAILVDADAYLPVLSRYIHLNPVKAGMVKRPQDYRWSSYRCLIKALPCPKWLYMEQIWKEIAWQGKIENIRQFTEGKEAFKQSMGEYPKTMQYPAVMGGKAFLELIKRGSG